MAKTERGFDKNAPFWQDKGIPGYRKSEEGGEEPTRRPPPDRFDGLCGIALREKYVDCLYNP